MRKENNRQMSYYLGAKTLVIMKDNNRYISVKGILQDITIEGVDNKRQYRVMTDEYNAVIFMKDAVVDISDFDHTESIEEKMRFLNFGVSVIFELQ